MISIIIPAHNEAELIGRTLTAVHTSMRAIGEVYEIIVVNDSSTDHTGEIALEHNARVISVNHRKISATRNAGAREATGPMLFFVDADTTVTERALRSALKALRRGVVGGGCAVRFDGPVPLYAKLLERVVLPVILPLFRLAPGCFLFCSRQAYVDAGGFDESMYWSEEVAFTNRLKRLGRFVILRDHVITSARKLRTHSCLGLIRVGIQLALRRPSGLDYWYATRKG